MPPCQSTLGYIDLAPSDAEEEHSSHHCLGGSVIDLTRTNSKEEQRQEEEEHAPKEVEPEGMHEGDLQEHMVVEESIASARREEAAVHHVVDDSLKTLRKDRLHAWLHAKKKDNKVGHVAGVPQYSMKSLMRVGWIRWQHRAFWDAREMEKLVGSSRHFTNDVEALGPGEGVVIKDAGASDTGKGVGFDNAIINLSSHVEEGI
jgi:hypothetical protein